MSGFSEDSTSTNNTHIGRACQRCHRGFGKNTVVERMGCLVQVILTTKEGATLSGNTLPVSYPKFTSMVQKGDTIFLGRYLVTGSEESSCYLTVRSLLFSPSAHE